MSKRDLTQTRMLFLTDEGDWSVADVFAYEARKVITDSVGEDAQLVQMTSALYAIVSPSSSAGPNRYVRRIADLYGVSSLIAFTGPAVLVGGFVPSTAEVLPIGQAHVKRCVDLVQAMRTTAPDQRA